ncbi:MAG: DNRLRE domain-containing protein [Candidatus Omnitrophota bacterium]
MKRKYLLFLTGLTLLTLIALPAHATVLVFNQGMDVWLSSSGTAGDGGNPNLGWGRSIGVNAKNYDTLIKFTNVFGTDPNQIPLGSTINSAVMSMWVGYDNNDTSYIYQMTHDWNEASSWTTIGSTGGIVAGVNTEAAPEFQWTGTTDAWSQRAFDLTASVQDWSGGADQFGWGITKSRNGIVTATSLNYSTASYRPFLTVDFSPAAVVPEPASIAMMGLGLCGLFGKYHKRFI